MAQESTRETEGLVTTRFGPKGTPDRDALDELEQIGKAAEPVAVNLNQMIRLAVRKYVEGHTAASCPPRKRK